MNAITKNLGRAQRVMRSFATADGRQIRGYFGRLGLDIEGAYYVARTIKFLRDPLQWGRRRAAMRLVKDNPALRGAISEERGFGKLPAHTLPGTDRIISLIRQKAAERKDSAEWWDPFQKKIFLPKDIAEHPEVLDFVLSDEVLQMVCEYFGTVPVLKTVQGWWSPKNDYMQNSQLYHRDNLDWREVKFFINVSDVGPDNGPFTLLPADVSEAVSCKLGNWRRSVRDDEMYRHCNETDAVRATGPAGTVSMVDTDRCFHYGARTKGDDRIVFMFDFGSYYSAMEHSTPINVDPSLYKGDELRSLVLGR